MCGSIEPAPPQAGEGQGGDRRRSHLSAGLALPKAGTIIENAQIQVLAEPWAPAFEGVILRNLVRSFAFSSFPRKREPRISVTGPPVQARGRLWVPAFAGTTHIEPSQYFLLRQGQPRYGGWWRSSSRFSCRRAKAGNKQLAICWAAQLCRTRHQVRSNGAQSRDDLPCFIEPPHLGVACCQNTV
jgi:hypothetical protein